MNGKGTVNAKSYGPNDSKNVPTYISTNITGYYDTILPNGTKILETENGTIRGF